MAEDREQKIREVVAAMRAKYAITDNGVWNDMLELARAAVDVLDPVKRIELSGGFHAQHTDSTAHYGLWKDGERRGLVGKDLADAWAEAVREIARLERKRDEQDVKRDGLREENEHLKQRIATLGRIIKALDGSVPEWS